MVNSNKFSVGDRVIVTKNFYAGRHGTVVNLTSHVIKSYAVQIDGLAYSSSTSGTVMSESELSPEGGGIGEGEN